MFVSEEWKVKPLVSFSPTYFGSPSISDPNTPLRTPFSNTLSLRSSLNMKGKNFNKHVE
jgi:hypothetical protein